MPARRLSLSATTLSLFQSCPRCFWLGLRCGITRPSGPFPSITRGIDALMQAACDATRPQLPGWLQVAALGAADGPSRASGLVHAALCMPKVAYLRCVPGPVPLVGHLDECLQWADGTYAPLDHKSRGSVPPPGYSAAYYQLQMDVYAWLLAEQGYRVREVAYVVYCFPRPDDGRTLHLEDGWPFGCVVDALPVSPARARAVYQAACACLDEVALPAPAATCPWCDYVSILSEAAAPLPATACAPDEERSDG